MYLNRKDAVSFMNELGFAGTPFLFIIDYEMEKIIVADQRNIPKNIFYELNGKRNFESPGILPKSVILKKKPVSFSLYKKAFNIVRKEIYDGNTYLLNLTFPTEIEINLTLEEIFHLSRAKYKLLIDGEFVVFSPESFVKIRNGLIYSYPMKGTIDDSIENAEQVILNDEKEMAEHYTIVDLIRNDLSIVAKNVDVEKFRYVEKLITHEKSLLQVSSKIKGKLPDNYKAEIGSLLFELLPAGSISGAPKKKTLEIINDVELDKRGFYTGIFGVFDGQDLDSAVMIRFIEKVNGNFVFRSGGGITYMSDALAEFQELIDKVYVPIA